MACFDFMHKSKLKLRSSLLHSFSPFFNVCSGVSHTVILVFISCVLACSAFSPVSSLPLEDGVTHRFAPPSPPLGPHLTGKGDPWHGRFGVAACP
eukprot:scaffold175072_cov45-Prasinocladus_malaysianus.AAC.2